MDRQTEDDRGGERSHPGDEHREDVRRSDERFRVETARVTIPFRNDQVTGEGEIRFSNRGNEFD